MTDQGRIGRRRPGEGPYRTVAVPAILSISLFLPILLLAPAPVAAEKLIALTSPSGSSYFVMEGETASFSIELTSEVDAEEAVVQWYKDGSPVVGDGLSYSFETDFDDAGTYGITVIVIYNASSDSHDWDLEILDVKEKFEIRSWHPPVETVEMREGQSKVFSVSVDNPAGDVLTYRWFVDRTYHTAANRSSFAFSPGLDDQGERTISVTVESPDHSEKHIWSVEVGHALEVSPPGEDLTLLEGDSMTFEVVVPTLTDNQVTWIFDQEQAGAASGRVYTYGPDHFSSGEHTLTVNTTTGMDHTWTITVLEVNRPPEVEPGGVKRVTAGETAVFQGVADDPDLNIVSYEWDFDGDGTFDHTSDQNDRATHKYDKAGTYLVTYRVTDASGATASTTFQYVVTEPGTISGWYLAAAVMGIMVLAVLAWMVLDVRRERMTRARGTGRLAEVPSGPLHEMEGEEDTASREREEVPLFEDVEEEEGFEYVEEEGFEYVEEEPLAAEAEDMAMVPYSSKMADRDLEAEGDVEDTEIGVTGRPEDVEGEEEGIPEEEEEGIDDLLADLTAKVQAKAGLKSKRASAEVGAEDTDLGIGPEVKGAGRERPGQEKDEGGREGKRPGPEEAVEGEERAGAGMDADTDIDADSSDDVELIMKSLIDKGLAERREDAGPKRGKRRSGKGKKE